MELRELDVAVSIVCSEDVVSICLTCVLSSIILSIMGISRKRGRNKRISRSNTSRRSSRLKSRIRINGIRIFRNTGIGIGEL